MKTIKDILIKYNLTQTKLSKELNIPLRTVQNWANEERKPPEYVVYLIDCYYQLKIDNQR